MTDDDYFYDRAEAELKLAEKAIHPRAVRAHYLLAGYYLDRFYGDAEDVGAASAGAIRLAS